MGPKLSNFVQFQTSVVLCEVTATIRRTATVHSLQRYTNAHWLMNDLFTTPSPITVLVCILSAFVRRIFVDSHLPYSYCVVGFFADLLSIVIHLPFYVFELLVWIEVSIWFSRNLWTSSLDIQNIYFKVSLTLLFFIQLCVFYRTNGVLLSESRWGFPSHPLRPKAGRF